MAEENVNSYENKRNFEKENLILKEMLGEAHAKEAAVAAMLDDALVYIKTIEAENEELKKQRTEELKKQK